MARRPPKNDRPARAFASPAGRPAAPVRPAAAGARATVPLPPAAMGAGPGSAFGAVPPLPTQADFRTALRTAAAHLDAGRYRPAAAIAQQVLEAFPGQPDALHLLGLVLYETGKPADAERLLATAIKSARAPSANMFVNFGNARREQGKLDEALAAYDKALTIDPLYPDAFLGRGIANRYKGQPEAALVDFNRLIELMPDHPGPYARATEVAMELGRFRDALAYCDKAIEKIPAPPPVIFSLKATIHERLTELDEALRSAGKALAIDPTDVEGVRVWARVQRRQSSGDGAILRAARDRLATLKLDGLPFDQRRGVHEELAQICDRLGDTDGAFREFTEMNLEAAREAALRKVDKRAYIRQVDTLIEAFTPDWVGSWHALPQTPVQSTHRAAPVFLVGFPRSGTTLLDQILDAHPDVQVIEERPLVRAVRDAAIELGGYPATLATLTAESREHLRQVYWRAVRGEGGQPEDKIVIDKMPLNLIHVGLIARVFPEARIILALRHPADCVLSCFMQNFLLNASMANFLDLNDAAHLYERVMTLWRAYEKLLPLNVHAVRYERLIGDLEAEVRPVLDFLGVSWNDAVKDPAAHALARGTIRTPSYAQVTQPIYSSAADRWRRYEKHLASALPALDKHIRHFGYSL